MLAQQNRAAVERMQRRIAWEEKLLTLKSQMPSELRTQDLPYELLSDEEPEFSVRNECDETQSFFRQVFFSRPGVYLHCLLPKLPDMAGTALVMFKSFKIRDALITFGHQGILTQLLPGANIGRAAEERPFLVAESSDNRGWWIQLSNVRIELTPQHTDELCEVVDRLAECYLTAAEDLERYVLRSIRFPYAQRGYRFIGFRRGYGPRFSPLPRPTNTGRAIQNGTCSRPMEMDSPFFHATGGIQWPFSMRNRSIGTSAFAGTHTRSSDSAL